MYLIFYIVFLVLGIWMAASAVKMKRTGEISDWILTEEDLKKCRKKAEFIAYLSPWMTAAGAATGVLGAIGIIGELGVIPIPYLRYIIMVGVLVVVGVFWTRLSHARVEYVL
ncbi:MAG: hypothetical protein LIO37_03195 [Clostridiales bacterium]|nr:hypothetical protein [Clostridiales bacterium]